MLNFTNCPGCLWAMRNYRKNRKAWSVLTAVVAVIWSSYAFSGVWGVLCPAFRALLIVNSHSDSGSLADEHARFCKCLSCPGGKRCCCLKNASSTPQEQALLTARCSDETPARTVVIAAAKIVFPAGIILPVVFSEPAIVCFPRRLWGEFPSQNSPPLLPPPRLS